MDKIKEGLTTNIFKGETKKGMPNTLIKIAKEKIFRIIAARDLKDLKNPPSNNLEKLKGDRDGQYSIRVNEKYRICFEWSGSEAFNIEFVDYHK
jgi:proteic killer suppression protein